MAVISQNFFYSVQSKHFLGRQKKETRKVLEQRYWQLVEQYRAQKRQCKLLEVDQEAIALALIKAADGLRDAYSLLAKNNTNGVTVLLDKAKVELKHLEILRCENRECDLPAEIEGQIVDILLSDSEKKEDIIYGKNIIDVVGSSSAILNTDVLVSASRGLLMSGVLKSEEEDLPNIIEQIDVKQLEYDEMMEQKSYQKLLTLSHDDFVPFVNLDDEKSKGTHDEQAFFQLQELGDINIPKNSGVLRKLKIDETRRFFSTVKKQKIMSVRIGVLGGRQQIEDFFAILGGRKIKSYLESKLTKNDLLFWRVALPKKLMLYVVGLPNDNWGKNDERDLLLTKLSSITLLKEQQTELTAEEDVAMSEIQSLCVSENIRLRGSFYKAEENNASNDAWALINPLLTVV